MNRSKATSSLVSIIMLVLIVLTNVQPARSQAATTSLGNQTSTFVQPGIHDPDSPEYVPEVVLLGLQSGVTIVSKINENQQHPYKSTSTSLDFTLDLIGAISVDPLFSNEQMFSTSQEAVDPGLLTTYRLQLKQGADVKSAVDALAVLPEVAYAEPDYIAFPADAPGLRTIPASNRLSPPFTVNPLTIDDPLYSQQWGLAKINIEGAWSATYGSPTVSIAVIDSGIDLTHIDLAAHLWVNPGEIAGNGVDDDNNGYIDDVNGWDFVSGNNDISDDNGHGTLVSGVAAAVGGNGQGIAGTCPQCSLMTVKVMQASGVANYSDIASGVMYAAQKGAKVINISLGGYANSNILRTAIDAAASTYGAVIVAGAGNDNLNQPFYPAAYDNVLAVAGTQNDDTKVGTSNYATWVDVSAPGIDIRTTALGGGWVDNSGTSFAAPYASGLAGLLRTLHPDWNQSTIRSQIVHTTDEIESANPTYAGLLGSGRLNAGTAMQAPHPLLAMSGYAVNGQTDGRPVLGASSQLTVTFSNDWWNALGVTGVLSTTDPYVTMTNGNTAYGDIAAGTTKTNGTPFSFSVTNGAGYNHSILFKLDVTDTTGYADSFNFTIMTEAGVVNKSGTIVANETWTNDKTYLIINNVGVAPGVTLTIQPGTTVKFNGNYSLNVGGKLVADGTSTQPIQFKSSTAGTWNQISFGDSSTDAQADTDGQYISGSILRHVNIEGAGTGITCTTSTPYLSHVNSNGGGITCALGATSVWFLDNAIVGSVSFTGEGSAYRNTVSAGGLSISGAGIAENNTVEGVLSLGSGIARRNTVDGLNIGGSNGILEANIISGNVGLGDFFNVVGNTIDGSLAVGNGATVDHNTISEGITVGSSAMVTWNNVENSSSTGLIAGENITAQYNRLINNVNGMVATSGLIEHNLIANNSGIGLQVGAATVRYNTFTGNQGNTIVVEGGTPLGITNNNLEGNIGIYDLYINVPNDTTVLAQNNWWGTTNTTTINVRIFDYMDDFTKNLVTYEPVLSESDQIAPGYVRNVVVTPDTTLGIQTGIFEVQFSKPMDINYAPTMEFYSAKLGTWANYTTSNSGLPNNTITSLAIDGNGTKWFGTDGGGVASFDGINWRVYNEENSGLPNNYIRAVAIENNGTKWFGTTGGLASFDGTNWTVYNTSNSILDGNSPITDIAFENNGTKWFVCDWGGIDPAGFVSFDGVKWKYYSSNLGGITPDLRSVAIDIDGTKWFGGWGLASFDGVNWVHRSEWFVHDIVVTQDGTKLIGTDNGLISIGSPVVPGYGGGHVYSIAVESNNKIWLGTFGNGVSYFDGFKWHNYNISNSGLLSNTVYTIAIESDGTKWFGTWNGGVNVLYGAKSNSIIDNSQWQSSMLYHASYDVTSAISKGTYRIQVLDGFDSDGMRIVPNSTTTFDVNYAGSISDKTPPLKPAVAATWNSNHTSVSANWSSSDLESPITMYRYAIGTSPGARDVVDWTYTTNTSALRNNLNLIPTSMYYISVGARNEGGLWSESGISGISTFTDTPSNFWAWKFIEQLYNAGVTGGCSTNPMKYCPNTNVNRAQMAVFLLRAEHGPTYFPPTATGLVFGDVTSDYWAASWIEQLSAEGITGGCGSGKYCPETPVTRGQMAVFLLRAKYGSTYTPPPYTGIFTDVPTDYWAATWIEALAAEGITGGCGGGKYCPNAIVNRAQMAVFLVKTFNLP